MRFEVIDSHANGWPEIDVHVSGTAVSWTLRVGSTTRHIASLTELLDQVRNDVAPGDSSDTPTSRRCTLAKTE
jgi:hypothetical protein